MSTMSVAPNHARATDRAPRAARGGWRRRAAVAVAAASVASMALAGCGGSGGGTSAAATPTQDAASFDLAKLVAAAKKEGGLTVWDSSASVSKIAKAFQQQYGIKTTALKISKSDAVTKLVRESQAGKVSADVLMFADGGSLAGQLLPGKLVTSWLPPDLASDVPAGSRDPLVAVWNPDVVYYNPTAYPKGCPVTNVWQLTQPRWKGEFAIVDPRQDPQTADFLTELTHSGSAALASAYQKLNGKPLDTSKQDAGHAFLAALAANQPVVSASDDDVTAAVGAKGAKNPPLGLGAGSKYAEAKEQGQSIAPCTGLQPWIGYASPKFGLITTKAQHPSAAELWIHFVLTEQGVKPALKGGGFSGNSTVPAAKDGPPGLAADHSDLFRFDLASLDEDWKDRQSTQDFWQSHLK
jgi:iron(III) transport system substrate-binding protein